MFPTRMGSEKPGSEVLQNAFLKNQIQINTANRSEMQC